MCINTNYIVGVAIATRNRADSLEKLLISISCNNIKPNLIFIVSSGENINNIINKYDKQLNLSHYHSNKSGQVLQRNIAIDLLKKKVDFILFLDDDVSLERDFFEKLNDKLKKIDPDVVGIGVKINGDHDVIPKFKFAQKIFYEWIEKPGSVLPSGVTTDYSMSEKQIDLSWINGLSIWRTKVFDEFQHNILPGEYAALEDLIFSYQVGQRYRLVFTPDIVLSFQQNHSEITDIFRRTKVSNLNRYYFVNKIMKISSVYYFINLFGKIIGLIILLIVSKNKKKLVLILVGHLMTPFYILINRSGNY